MTDTIVAQSTPYGYSGVGILRISGEKTREIINKTIGLLPQARFAHYTTFFDYFGCAIDVGIAIWFPKPYSFTGEDVLELHGHGNPVIMDLLIKSILCFKNVRMARPGEFSERAFINGKIDLIQAESIIKLIYAASESSVKFALRSLTGEFSIRINNLISSIIEIRMLIEAILNFSDEDCDIQDQDLNLKIQNILKKIKSIYKTAQLGHIVNDGIKIVLSGETNVGKSTIFNCLSSRDSAIVTNIPGTTRDVLREYIQIKGANIELIDTAGFRVTKNIIEKIGIHKAWEQIKTSNHIFLVLDDSQNILYQKNTIVKLLKNIKYNHQLTIIINKCDFSNRKPRIKKYFSGRTYIIISAKMGLGIKNLIKYLEYLVQNFMQGSSETVFLARRRHLNILKLVNQKIKNIKINWFSCKNIELLAEDFKMIQNMLNEITGSVTSDDILKSIFKNFCIGK